MNGMPLEQRKLIWWRIALGSVLVYTEIRNYLYPASNLLRASDATEQVGLNAAMAAIACFGCWLVYSGVKPGRQKG